MSVHFNQELEALKQTLLTMAAHAETAVARALRSLNDQDDALARRVKEEDKTLDGFEIQVDETSINLLAKAPLASHLRFITIAMKISHDLERVGDEATTIARRARELIGKPKPELVMDIPAMAGLVLQMLRGAIDSFVNHDSAKARAVIPEDKKVDALNKQIYRALSDYMVEHPEAINACLHWMFIAKCLERIGDHATNIAEEVVYLCEALDIRHDPEIKRPKAAE